LDNEGSIEVAESIQTSSVEREAESEGTEEGPSPRSGESEHLKEAEFKSGEDSENYKDGGFEVGGILSLGDDGEEVSGEEDEETDNWGNNSFHCCRRAGSLDGGAVFSVGEVGISGTNTPLGEFVATASLATFLKISATALSNYVCILVFPAAA
jgi:hypothetical protein